MAKLLWEPTKEQIQQSNMYRFMTFINENDKQNFTEYAPLYEWSIENIAEFWAAFWVAERSIRPCIAFLSDWPRMTVPNCR